jgi:hypothetical protein
VQAFCERALRNGSSQAVTLFVLTGLLFLAGCANEGIFPKAELPAANVGPPPPFPTLSAAPLEEDDRVLTTAEREAMEAQLSKLASEREAGVRRRIERSK